MKQSVLQLSGAIAYPSQIATASVSLRLLLNQKAFAEGIYRVTHQLLLGLQRLDSDLARRIAHYNHLVQC